MLSDDSDRWCGCLRRLGREWGQQLPYLDEFVIEFVEDLDTGLARFIAGETDAWVDRLY